MANDLEIKKNDVIIKSSANNNLSDVIKPLVKEIHLFDTFIAGTSYIEKELLERLKVDDKLTLQRENNKYDAMNDKKKINLKSRNYIHKAIRHRDKPTRRD